MALKIPKALLNEYGYNKNVAAGKWFTIEEIKFKLGFIRESKYYKSHIEEVSEAVTKKKDETVLENGDRALKLWADFLCKSVVLDWDMVDDVTNEKAELNGSRLYELLEAYPHLVQGILDICTNNKKFLKDISTKK